MTTQHTGLLAHDGYAEHSHEVRPDHDAVPRILVPHEGQTLIWYDALLSVRVPSGEHRLMELDSRIGIHVGWRSDPQERRIAAKREAEAAFRKLGFGYFMDQPDARVSISVRPA